jgi:NADPH-dependent 2,4-dienoyl-CoA reductase/sulfur reductase-like enzyme
MSGDGVLIVGGGLASQRAVETLRSRGYDGPIRMVCGEAQLPYDRPPLSKELLAGKVGEAEIAFRPVRWYAEQAVELVLGLRATALDPRRRRVRLADGTELPYDELLIATGSAPRTLPQLEGFSNVHSLRTMADARRLRRELRKGSRLAIVGAGFIGQEVASTARAAGAEVTLVEALPAPLAGILGERIGRWLIAMHSDEGVDVRAATTVEGACGNGSVEELVLSGDERLATDVVIVGVGVLPDAGWLDRTRLGAEGVATDSAGRTALPHVYAAGDVTRPYDERAGTRRRSEHWDAAARQGAAAARAILGDASEPQPPSSFWSDQYGLRIQYAGYADLADDMTIEGRPEERRFAAVYTRAGRPVGALTVDDPRGFARLRREIHRTFSNESDERKDDELHPQNRHEPLQRTR